jgi:hypothetical protein
VLLGLAERLSLLQAQGIFRLSDGVGFGAGGWLICRRDEFADQQMAGCLDLLFGFQPVFLIVSGRAAVLFPNQIGQPRDFVVANGRNFFRGHFSLMFVGHSLIPHRTGGRIADESPFRVARVFGAAACL